MLFCYIDAFGSDWNIFSKNNKSEVESINKSLYVSQGNSYIIIEHTPKAIAEHICTYGLHEDITIYTEDGDFLLSTFGIYINQCPNQRFLQEELLPVLIPMQMEVEDRIITGSIEQQM